MVSRLSIILGVLLICSAASAQGSHSAQEEKACRRDAQRFCKDAMPDEFRVLSCLQAHRQKISQACRDTLDGHGA